MTRSLAKPEAVARPFAGAESLPWHVRYRVPVIAALFLLVVLAEMWAPITRGQYYTAGDFGQDWGITTNQQVSGPTKNGLQFDVYTFTDPELALDIRSVRSGHLPLWNQDNGNGEPLLAGMQSATFSPFTVPFYLLPFGAALVVSAGLKLWFMAFFTFLWLRRLLGRDLPAVIAGVLFAFAGYQIIWLNWQAVVGSAAAVPFGLWCIQVALDWLVRKPLEPPDVVRRRRVLRLCFAGGAAAIGMAILGGHPETALWGSILLGIYLVAGGIYRLRIGARLWKWTAAGVAAGVVGAAITAAVALPFLQYESLSTRAAAHNVQPAPTTAARHLSTVPMMAFPNLFGMPGPTNYDKTFYTDYRTNYAELNDIFTGLLTLSLAPLGLAGLWTRRTRFTAAIGLGLALLDTVLLYTVAGYRVWFNLPFLGRASPGRSQNLMLLGLVVLAAVGVDWLRCGPDRGRFRDWRYRAAGVVVSAGVVSGLAIGGAEHLRHQIGHAGQGLGGATAVSSSFVEHQMAVQLACVVIALGMLVVLMWRRASGPRVVIPTSGVLVAASCVSVMLPLASWNPTVSSSVNFPKTPALTSLRTVVGKDLSMYLRGSFAPAMTNAWFDLADVGSYDALGVAWQSFLYAKAFGTGINAGGQPNARTEQMPACIDELRLFGVERIVGNNGKFGDGDRLTPHTLAALRPYAYYDVPGSGLVSVVGRAATVAGDATAMSEVTNCAFDANREVVLDSGEFDATKTSPRTPMSGAALSGATAKVVSRDSTALTIETHESAPGWLVIRQTWFPGWQARVDGHAVPLKRADVAFDAVPVPAGAHRVTLRYAPAILSWGIDISLAAVGIVVVIVFWAVMDWPVPPISRRRTRLRHSRRVQRNRRRRF